MGKPTHIKVDFHQIGHIAQSIQPDYVGTAVLLLIAIHNKDYAAVERLAPKMHPVGNQLMALKWVEFDNAYMPILTEAGTLLVKSLLLKAPVKAKGPSQREKDVDTWIAKWIEMWPRVKEPNTKKYVATEPKDITKKMKQFVNEYDYTVEEIIKATEVYLVDRYKVNWEFIKLANNFIFKNKESVLAQWCHCVRTNNVQPEEINRLTRHI